MKLDRLLRAILSTLVVSSLTFIMLVTFVDVFLRYLFKAPITGSSELIKFAMAAAIFAALPLVTADERHIAVSVVRLPSHGWAGWLHRLAVLVLSGAATGVLAWRLTLIGRDGLEDGASTNVLHLPLGALALVMGILSGIAMLYIMILLTRHMSAKPHRLSVLRSPS